MATEQEVQIARRILKAVAEAIRELGNVPSGHLYTRLMSMMTLDQYDMVINALKKLKLVKEQNHLLTWIGY